uniref:Uncharacterized protein n=1 Tax=Lepeophtheirus salmonis TaxID=72036 RepID=A0A0K2V229_LEPSM
MNQFNIMHANCRYDLL